MKNFDLRQDDVRLRGCGFTLFPAAKEANINEESMHTILFAAENKFKSESIPEKREDREKWPLTYTKEELMIFDNFDINALIQEDLITKTGEDEFTLTEKTLNVLLRAKEIDEQLSKEGFYHCPCCRCC